MENNRLGVLFQGFRGTRTRVRDVRLETTGSEIKLTNLYHRIPQVGPRPQRALAGGAARLRRMQFSQSVSPVLAHDDGGGSTPIPLRVVGSLAAAARAPAPAPASAPAPAVSRSCAAQGRSLNRALQVVGWWLLLLLLCCSAGW